MPEPGVTGAEQLAAHPGRAGEGAHEDEQRDQAEREVGGVADRRQRHHAQRRFDAAQTGEAADADDRHGDADGNAQQHEREQDDEAEPRDEVVVHPRRRYPGGVFAPAAGTPGRISRHRRTASRTVAATMPIQARA